MHKIKLHDGESVAQYISEDSHKKSNMLLIDDHVYAVRNTKLLMLTGEQEDALQYCGSAQGFFRLLKEGIMYHCTNYSQCTRNNTFCVFSCAEDTALHYGQIEQFLLTPKPVA